MQNDIFNWKANKRMKALGVDEAAKEAFEQEKRAGHTRIGFNFITFTENWLYYDSGWSSALFPLRDIVRFEKDYSPMRNGARFYVNLHFRDGGRHKLPCEFEQLDEIAAALNTRLAAFE